MLLSAGGIDSFHGQLCDRSAFRARLGIERFKKIEFTHGCGNWHTLGAEINRRALRTVQSGDEILYPMMLMFFAYRVWEPVYMESLLMLE